MQAFIVLASVLACAYGGGLASYGGFPYAAGVAPYTSAYHTTTVHGAAPYAAYAAPAYAGHAYAAPAYAGHAYAAPAYAGHAYAAPAFAAHGYAAPAAVVAPAFSKTQYHAQDELGQASYGYAHPGQAHSAVRDAAGNVRGAYAYINPDGNEIRVNYVADAGGFRVESNALPQAPVHVLPPPALLPAPVAETPEVVEARAAHALAHAEANARSLRKKRGVIAAPALAYAAAHPIAYSAPAAFGYSTAVHHPALAYSAAHHHGFGYSTAAVHHPALAYSAAYPALGYSAAAVFPTHHVREATLTKIVNTPGHAVSYRVD